MESIENKLIILLKYVLRAIKNINFKISYTNRDGIEINDFPLLYAIDIGDINIIKEILEYIKDFQYPLTHLLVKSYQ